SRRESQYSHSVIKSFRRRSIWKIRIPKPPEWISFPTTRAKLQSSTPCPTPSASAERTALCCLRDGLNRVPRLIAQAFKPCVLALRSSNSPKSILRRLTIDGRFFGPVSSQSMSDFAIYRHPAARKNQARPLEVHSRTVA